MKQQTFEAANNALWASIEKIINDTSLEPGREFPANYRSLCHHLAVAKSRRYTSSLIAYLNGLVVSAHHIVYQKKKISEQRWIWFLIVGFPAAIRANKGYVFAAALLFLIPLLLIGYGCYADDELIYSVTSSEDVAMFESMYNPEKREIGRERDSSSDIAMFGYYIQNNIGIGFRTFASGIVFGLGAIFFLIFNGIQIGGVAGYLTQIGYVDTFYGFVVGHGAFELTAIVFCGAAGLKLGFSLLDPGALSRMEAIKRAGREAILIVYGSAIMLLIAAFLEAFWSSSQEIPLTIKYSFGATVAGLLLLYFLFCGRRYES